MNRLWHSHKGVSIAFLLMSLATTSLGEEKSLLELGAGVGGLTSSHYPGADQSYLYVVPVPYVVYRGEYLQANQSGVKAVLANNRKLEFSLSAAAGLPVDSDDNRAREEMPSLGWLLELGPLLRYLPLETESGVGLRLELPVRAAFELDDTIPEHRGWTVSPSILIDKKFQGWKFTGSVTSMFGNRAYNGFFYDVKTPFVMEDRPYYRARAGYTATRLGLAATRRVGDWFLGAFAHAYTLEGTDNQASPLMRDTSNFSAGFMIARVFYYSPEKAKSDRDD